MKRRILATGAFVALVALAGGCSSSPTAYCPDYGPPIASLPPDATTQDKVIRMHLVAARNERIQQGNPDKWEVCE